MNKIKHIIWDWNGTVVDDGWLFVELINCVLKKRNMQPISLLDYQKTFCFPLEKYYMRLGFNFKNEPYEVPSMEFVELYNKNKYRPKLYRGMVSLLQNLKKDGIKNYLLSAQNNNSLLDLAGFYNLTDLFEKIVGTDNFHARGKELLAKKLVTAMRQEGGDCLFVGDTNLDVKIASSEKSLIFAVCYGHQLSCRFPKQKNVVLIKSPENLISLLNSKL